MKNIKQFILESAKMSYDDTNLSIFPAYCSLDNTVGVAICKPMSVEEASTEYKAIELKAKQQFGVRIEESWRSYMTNYDLEGNPHKYILFVDASENSSKIAKAYWCEFSDIGCQRIVNL